MKNQPYPPKTFWTFLLTTIAVDAILFFGRYFYLEYSSYDAKLFDGFGGGTTMVLMVIVAAWGAFVTFDQLDK